MLKFLLISVVNRIDFSAVDELGNNALHVAVTPVVFILYFTNFMLLSVQPKTL